MRDQGKSDEDAKEATRQGTYYRQLLGASLRPGEAGVPPIISGQIYPGVADHGLVPGLFTRAMQDCLNQLR